MTCALTPDLRARSEASEWMDDLSITDERLADALEELRLVNRWLGGYRGTLACLEPLLRREGARRTVRVLDVGTGGADLPEAIVRWASRRGLRVEVCATDLNGATLAHAGAILKRTLAPELRRRITLEQADALALPYADGAFDVVTASLFMHHLREPECVRLLQEMQRVGRFGLVVNDLHRHALAYHAIRSLALLLRASSMFRHDAPVSVARGFRRGELQRMAEAAGLAAYRLRRRWAFRWVLSTTPVA